MILEVQADNWAEFYMDGTSLGSVGQNVVSGMVLLLLVLSILLIMLHQVVMSY